MDNKGIGAGGKNTNNENDFIIQNQITNLIIIY